MKNKVHTPMDFIGSLFALLIGGIFVGGITGEMETCVAFIFFGMTQTSIFYFIWGREYK